MMSAMKNLLVSLFFGSILGYLLYYCFFMEILAIFFTGGLFYLTISIAVLIMSIVGCFGMIYTLIQKRISKWILILLMVAYGVSMMVVLFGRSREGHIAVLNPIVGLYEMSNPEMAVESALNIILFIPIGFFLKNMKKGNACLLALAVSAAIEIMQYVTMRGIFDTLDIILYVVGILIGHFLFRKVNLKIE